MANNWQEGQVFDEILEASRRVHGMISAGIDQTQYKVSGDFVSCTVR